MLSGFDMSFGFTMQFISVSTIVSPETVFYGGPKEENIVNTIFSFSMYFVDAIKFYMIFDQIFQ